MIMNKEKLKGYESPTTDVLELRIENEILIISGGGLIESVLEDEYGDF